MNKNKLTRLGSICSCTCTRTGGWTGGYGAGGLVSPITRLLSTVAGVVDMINDRSLSLNVLCPM